MLNVDVFPDIIFIHHFAVPRSIIFCLSIRFMSWIPFATLYILHDYTVQGGRIFLDTSQQFHICILFPDIPVTVPLFIMDTENKIKTNAVFR